MIEGYSGRATLAGRFILAIDRLLTWGMEPQVRERILAEQTADWHAMAGDEGQSSSQMLARQVRGIPHALWWRLTRRDVTTIPAGLALVVLAAAVALGLAVPDYPWDHRIGLLLVSLGMVFNARYFLSQPRRIVVAELRLPSLLIGAGLIAAAATFPQPGDFAEYDPADVTTPLIDLIMQIGLVTAGIGCLLIVAASFSERSRRLVLSGGALVVLGNIQVALTEVAWGLWVARTDLAVALVALGVAFGAGFFAHMMLRLRRIEIV